MRLSHTQREDLTLTNEEKLIDRILHEYLDLREVQTVEILCPYEEKEFACKLKEKMDVANVYVTHTNGPIQKEIERGYRKFLDDRISFYRKRIQEKFVRITILSPFPMPIARSDAYSLYLKNIHELDFVNAYLLDHQRCIVVKPNTLWAHKLNISLDELWNKVNILYEKESILQSKLDYMNSLGIKSIYFTTEEGTNVSFAIGENDKFTGKYLECNGVKFVGNAPSLEIYIAPIKTSAEGRIVFTKPFVFNGRIIKNHRITLQKGKVVSSSGLDEVLALDPSLSYIGEVALCEYIDYVFYNRLLDENTGCHIALGNAYPYEICDKTAINTSMYHFDLVFGSSSLCASVVDKYGETIEIIKNGKVVI